MAEHKFGFSTLQLHVGQEEESVADSRAILFIRRHLMCSQLRARGRPLA